MARASTDTVWLNLSFEIGVNEQARTQVPEEVEVWVEDTAHGPRLHYAAYDANGGFMAADIIQPDESGSRFHIDLVSDATDKMPEPLPADR